MRGDFERAWSDFDAAARQDGAPGYAIYARGVAALRLGREAEGRADIARAGEMEQEGFNYYASAGLRPD
jgi:Flp pilus assembly protein TadD